jgi:hypothetical protein
MRIILDGKRMGKGCVAVYFENKAYFTKRGLTKRTILHELSHRLAYVDDLEMSRKTDERETNSYARDFLDRHSVGS